MKFEKQSFDFLSDVWQNQLDKIYPEVEIEEAFDFDDLSVTEWDDEFEQHMRNRMIMGAFRYGRLKAKNKPQYDRIKSLLKRVSTYIETGNKECLVDGANMLLLEYVEGVHSKAHFKAIDDGEHTEVLKTN